MAEAGRTTRPDASGRVERNHAARSGGTVPDGSAAAASAQCFERLGQDRFAVGVAATLLDVCEVGLVGLVARRSRRVLVVLPGGQPAPRAVPQLGRLDAVLLSEARPRLVAVRAPVRDDEPRSRLAALGLSHRTCTDP